MKGSDITHKNSLTINDLDQMSSIIEDKDIPIIVRIGNKNHRLVGFNLKNFKANQKKRLVLNIEE